MRILFLTDNFPPETNAPASRTHEHAKRWVQAGHEVTVITCAPNFPDGVVHAGYKNRWRQVESMAGIRVVRVKTFIAANEGFLLRTLDYVSFMISSVIAGLFEKRPHVLVATSPQFFCACGGWLLSAVRRLPFVFELRDLWPATILAVGAMRRGILIKLLERLELFLYRRADQIVSVTEAFKKDLVARGIPAEKIEIVTNGADLERFSPIPRDSAWARELGLEGKFIVGYIGTHGMTHGLDSILEAAKLVQADPDVAFIFVGTGAEKAALQQKALQASLSNVKFLPQQPKEKMPAVWSLCDAALIPLKDRDLFRTVIPSKLFEAMAMGVPIIMSIPAGEATQILQQCDAGLIVEPENPASLATAVREMKADELKRKAFAANGVRSVGEFSRERKAMAMLQVIQKVAGTEQHCAARDS
jgi:glycosyltransferase involved in cell wall biosynthesis